MKTKLIVAFLTMLALTGLTAGTSAAAAPVQDRAPAASLAPADLVGRYVIQNRYSGRCLDADLNTINGNGTKVQLWDCNGSAQQLWYLHIIDGYYVIQSARNGRVLDADPISMWRNGTTVRLWQYNGGLNQKWTRWFDGLTFEFSSANSPYRSLDADLVTMWRNGTTVQLWDSGWGVANQQWYLHSV